MFSLDEMGRPMRLPSNMHGSFNDFYDFAIEIIASGGLTSLIDPDQHHESIIIWRFHSLGFYSSTFFSSQLSELSHFEILVF